VKVGQGAHGVVYQCRDIKTGQIWAVKVMTGDDELIRICKRTYNILRLFDNSSIAKGRKLFID
jgi:serine/threonine protein kinase